MILQRRVRPYRFDVDEVSANAAGLGLMPGVVVEASGTYVTRDSVDVAARALGLAVPEGLDVVDERIEWPGLAEYFERMHARMRPYQPTMIGFLAARGGAICADSMRSGKCADAIAASIVVGAKRVLVLSLAVPKWGWADEVFKWTGGSALLLDGRAGTEARWYCTACAGRGSKDGSRCKPCKGNGTRVVQRDELDSALRTARFTICNYDILIGQKDRTLTGVEFLRDDLPGWVPRLRKSGRFDVVLLDESHKIGQKGWRRKTVSQLLPRNEHDRTWLLTGTPTNGRLSTLWYQLDLASGGLWGGNPKPFEARYCGGHAGDYGWTVPKNGKTEYAETELRERLRHVMLKRDREDLAPHMPLKTRQVIRIEAKAGATDGADRASTTWLESGLNATAMTKAPFVVDAVAGEMAEGAKVVVFGRRRDTTRAIGEQLERQCVSRAQVALRAQSPIVFNAVGASSDSRVDLARRFREHHGAAAFVATIDGFQVGVSLDGAASVHFADLHWDPTAILQCEERPNEFTRTAGLVVVFYLVKGSVDEHLESVLIPKLEMLETALGDKGARSLRDDLGAKETLEAVWRRHTAHLKGERE